MPRKNIYFKDKIDREIQDIVDIEIQKGATGSETNYSSTVNELVRLGLMVHKSKEEGSTFDLDGFSVNATICDRYLPFSCPLDAFFNDAVRFPPFHRH
uniref:relaxosome protein TraM n=1 Tax=Citrobacter freundii TaxID=546 RepID=UPI001F3EBBE3|nr:hypothetical protein [Citrobacter freundii]